MAQSTACVCVYGSSAVSSLSVSPTQEVAGTHDHIHCYSYTGLSILLVLYSDYAYVYSIFTSTQVIFPVFLDLPVYLTLRSPRGLFPGISTTYTPSLLSFIWHFVSFLIHYFFLSTVFSTSPSLSFPNVITSHSIQSRPQPSSDTSCPLHTCSFFMCLFHRVHVSLH